MTREQLAHVLRAASRIAGRREIIVIGSQAILGSFDDAVLPGEAIGSVEADLCFFGDTDDALADQVDGAIGEASTFHATFGYYAQGVSVSTAVLPPGWDQRLVTYASPATEPAAGLCLDPHNLVAAKLAAGRPKISTSWLPCSGPGSSIQRRPARAWGCFRSATPRAKG